MVTSNNEPSLMSYPAHHKDSICKLCFYKNQIWISQNVQKFVCNKYHESCDIAQDSCSYSKDAAKNEAKLKEIELFNLHFKTRSADQSLANRA